MMILSIDLEPMEGEEILGIAIVGHLGTRVSLRLNPIVRASGKEKIELEELARLLGEALLAYWKTARMPTEGGTQ